MMNFTPFRQTKSGRVDCRPHFKLIILLLLGLFVIGCAALGSETIYRTDGRISFQTIGYTNTIEDSLGRQIYSQVDSLHREQLKRVIVNHGYRNAKQITGLDMAEDKNRSSDQVAKMCKSREVDVLLVSRLRFVNTVYSVYGVPYEQNWNTEVKASLYSSNGDLLVSTLHNTYKGNSYWTPPGPEVVVKDGVEGALSKMFEEIGK